MAIRGSGVEVECETEHRSDMKKQSSKDLTVTLLVSHTPTDPTTVFFGLLAGLPQKLMQAVQVESSFVVWPSHFWD